MNHVLGRPTILLLLTLAPLFRCSGEAAEVPVAGARSAIVSRGEFVERLLLTGELDAPIGAVISVPQLPQHETSLRWLAEDGTEVREGDRVAELDASNFTQNLEENRRQENEAIDRLVQAQAESVAELEDRRLAVDLATVALEKARIDAAIPSDLVPKNEYEDLRLAVVRAETELAKANENLRAQQIAARVKEQNLAIEIEKARRTRLIAERALAGMTLRAPRSGILVVVELPWEGRKLQIGDTIWVGFPIARIPELSSLRVVADLADVDDGRIAPGMPAAVTIDAYPERTFAATVVSVAPVAQERHRNSLLRTSRVTLKLAGTDPSIMRPGLSVRVDVTTHRSPNVLLIPRGAIDFAGDRPTVRTQNGRNITVELGRCNATQCVVKSGLEENDRVQLGGRTSL
jgi:multidrug resistance efflux pump